MLALPLDIFCLEVTYPIQVLYFPFHCICATGLLAEKISQKKMQQCHPFPHYSTHFPSILPVYFCTQFPVKEKKRKNRGNASITKNFELEYNKYNKWIFIKKVLERLALFYCMFNRL